MKKVFTLFFWKQKCGRYIFDENLHFLKRDCRIIAAQEE